MTTQVFDHPSCKVLITGTSGTGKTTLFENLLRTERARLKFIFDHQGEFFSRFAKPKCTDPDQLCEAVARGGYVVFDPVEMFAGKMQSGFAFFCESVFLISQRLKGRKIFGCDELQKLVANDREPEELLAILDSGRRYQLDFFAISQAPNRIHNAIRNQLTQVYTFRQSDANAVKYLAENGFNEEAVRSLPRGRYLWKNLDTGETREGGEAFQTDEPRN